MNSNEDVEVITVPAMVSETEVAEILGLTKSALRQQRIRNKGLPYRKMPNGHIVYDVSDLKAYILGTKIYTKDFPNPVSS